MSKLAGLVLAAALLTAGPAWAGWEKLEWGMTPEQAAAAMPDVAKLDKGGRDDELDGAVMGNKGPYAFAGKDLIAAFYYDDRGLGQVKIWKSGMTDCKSLLTALTKQYGQPLRAENQSILGLFVWHDARTQARVSLVASQGVLCSLDYYRLSDYEAIDRKKAVRSSHQ